LPTLDIIVPCFNEADNLPALFASYLKFKKQHQPGYITKLIIVDNGSLDNTVSAVKEFVDSNPDCRLISLSRNFGKEASLTAALFESTGDLVVPIDADLQDPIEVISQMLACWESHSVDVVLARRVSREGDSTSRRIYSILFSRLFNSLADIEMPPDVGEFRLMSRKVVDAFCLLPESERFVRGLFAWLGFKSETVEFERNSREIGKSRFSYRKLFNLAIDALISFSTKPLRISIGLGLFASASSFCISAFVAFEKIFNHIAVPGYASTTFLILFLGGIQMFSIGLLGEYVGKILIESKRRPIYIIAEKYGEGGNL